MQRIPETTERLALPGAEPYDAALASRLQQAVAAKGSAYIPRTRHLVGKAPKYINRLIFESSPYLLQHAHNPVCWYPWGDEAFAEAKRLQRPVFLSSGYSTCHWCHVMEEESFEDEEIAAYLNSHYICIKLDREERPDVDAIYMTAVQALNHGSGGWPMSVWLNHKREPFFAGTYFPPRDGIRGAHMGFISILKNLASLYAKEPARIANNCEALMEAVKAEMEAVNEAALAIPSRASSTAITNTVATIKRIADRINGGTKRAPKFPSNIPVRLLLRYHRRSGDADALHIATLTLEKMAAGGLMDQLGGGFHRYSTDEEWLAPHFEKMLYDNALLAVAYVEAYQATGRRDFARVTRQTLDYVLREMTSPEGGFYSATDADSEGEEGKFFVWSEKEVRTLLGDSQDTDRFIKFYDITSKGNWEHHNILRVLHPDETAWQSFETQRTALYNARLKRIPPLRDEKILASWNGLMISALAKAGRILHEPRYIAAATSALSFVLDRMRLKGGKLARSFKDNKVGVVGFLDDYSFVAAAALDLYEATLEKKWLDVTIELVNEMDALFGDRKTGGWYKTSLSDHEVLIAREKSLSDGSEPAGSSVALLTLVRLSALTGGKYDELVRKAFAAISPLLEGQPLAVHEALLAVDFVTDNVLLAAIVWPSNNAGKNEIVQAVSRVFAPSTVVCGAAQDQVENIAAQVPWMKEKIASNNTTTLYLCDANGTCKLPIIKEDQVANAFANSHKSYESARHH